MRVLLLFIFALSFCLSYEKIEEGSYVEYQIEGDYDEVVFALLDEISANGYILSYRADIKKISSYASKALNKKEPFLNANKIGFCKASNTLKMMEENPKNILFCPISIAIYETQKDKINIIYLKSQSLREGDSFFKEVNKEVIFIIEEAIFEK